MATKLSLYNGALRHLGARRLVSTSEDQEPRYYLDEEWDDTLLYCLRQGFWNFAMRVVEIDHSTTMTPAFGWAYAFEKPSDWIKTREISTNEDFSAPLNDFQDQQGYWLADSTPLYARFVSTNYGIEPSNFPSDYGEYVAAVLAYRIFKRVTGHGEDELAKFERRVLRPVLRRAQANDAMDGPVEFAPVGAWAAARSNGRRGDGGSSGSLIG